MSIQHAPIRRTCQGKDCVRDAVIGLYTWSSGETDVNLDRPVRVFCGPHKLKLDFTVPFRNVRLAR